MNNTKNDSIPVIIGKLLSHYGGGFGFKLTFNTINEAEEFKNKLIRDLVKQGYSVSVDKESYYEGGDD